MASRTEPPRKDRLRLRRAGGIAPSFVEEEASQVALRTGNLQNSFMSNE